MGDLWFCFLQIPAKIACLAVVVASTEKLLVAAPARKNNLVKTTFASPAGFR
jgi:hypothetical protein